MTDNLPEARMSDFAYQPVGRRAFLGGTAGLAVLALPGCASLGGFSLVDAVRRLLYLSSERAFARLVAPGGFWDEQVAAIGLSDMLGTRGGVLSTILTSALFRDRLQDAFADVAIEGAYRAAPIVTDAVRVIGISNALALVNGGPTAATEFLRGSMGSTLVEAMVPELGQAMRLATEPLVAQLLQGLTGIDVAGVSQNFANAIDTTIWQEMGIEEAAIRANPRGTGDPLLIGVLSLP